MRRLVFICAAVAAVLGPSIADAQRAADLLTAGTWVRVSAPPVERMTAAVVGYSGDVLTVTQSGNPAQQRIATEGISQLEISRGRNRLSWGVGGLFLGGVVGGIINGIQGGHDEVTGLSAAVGFAAGFLRGAIVGGIAGAVFAPERWQDEFRRLKW